MRIKSRLAEIFSNLEIILERLATFPLMNQVEAEIKVYELKVNYV